MFKRACQALALSAALMTLSGCAHKAPSNATDYGSFANTPACTNNTFLQKYGCSLDRIEKAAMNNDADAQYALGYMYYYGIGTVRDQQTATLWIKRAASQGQPLAIQAMKIITHTQYPQMGSVAMQRSNLQSVRKVAPITRTSKQTMPKTTMTITRVKPKKSVVTANAAKPTMKTVATMPVLKAVKNHYTLQLMASHDLTKIKALLKHADLGDKAGYYHTYFNGKDWYVAIYGDYASASAAKSAIASLPAAIRAQHPWVKPFALVQKEISQSKPVAG